MDYKSTLLGLFQDLHVQEVESLLGLHASRDISRSVSRVACRSEHCTLQLNRYSQTRKNSCSVLFPAEYKPR